MRRHHLVRSLLATLVVVTFGSSSRAQVTTYTSESAFLAALLPTPAPYTENYSSFSAGNIGNPVNFSSGAFAYSASAPSGQLVIRSVPPNVLSTTANTSAL